MKILGLVLALVTAGTIAHADMYFECKLASSNSGPTGPKEVNLDIAGDDVGLSENGRSIRNTSVSGDGYIIKVSYASRDNKFSIAYTFDGRKCDSFGEGSAVRTAESKNIRFVSTYHCTCAED